MSFLISPRRKQYSIDRLRVLYTDLLQHIDVAKEDLGRSGINDEDANFHKKSMRFSFRRKILPNEVTTTTTTTTPTTTPKTTPSTTTTSSSSSSTTTEKESRDEPNQMSTFGKDNNNNSNGSNNNNNSNRELVAAFRMLAATKSPDKEGDNFGAVAVRDEAILSAMSTARAIEERVVELIETIGEIIVNAEQIEKEGKSSSSPTSNSSSTSSPSSSSPPIPSQKSFFASPHVRSDPVFEYFCEKNILSLLVDIAKEARQGGETRFSDSLVHGVVWSPLVKAQVLQTASLLISDVRNHSVLYYLLSHNYINDLIQCMLPLKQWTDQALVKMMPSYVELLKTVTIQLADDPHLFPFLIIEDENKDNPTRFPLFTASMEVATSAFAQSDSLIYGTSLAVAVNIMQISYSPVHNWVTEAGVEQRRLADHLCQGLLDRFYKITSLSTGPVVDSVRSNAIAGQLAGLRDHLGMIREVFWSGVRGLDVRLCESLLQRVVSVLLRNLLPSTTNRPFLAAVGEIDADVIPESEAMAQVSTIFLSQMFTNLAYVPLQRMLAVALFHPKSTPLWTSTQSKKDPQPEEAYIFMPALSDIVNGVESRVTIPNPYRDEIFRSLCGDHGEWRVLASATLIRSILCSENTDNESLNVIGVIPSFDDVLDYEPTSLEKAIQTYLEREHRPSRLSSKSLECVGMLVLQLIQRIVKGLIQRKNNSNIKIKGRLQETVLWKSMINCRNLFNNGALKCLETMGISNIFLDLVESEINTRYTSSIGYDSGKESKSYTCSLRSRISGNDSEILVRKLRDVSPNDVETARFLIRSILHYRALYKVIERYCFDVERALKTDSKVQQGTKRVDFELVEKADWLIRTIGGLKEALTVGTDLDLTGRMTFSCRSVPKRKEPRSPKGKQEKKAEKKRDLGNNIGVFRSDTRLVLVLDPTDMNVVRPAAGQIEENRGTVLCSISLRSVIAAATDDEWLHIAVRHEDVTSLIKNGNMALKFDNSGTPLVVKQYLDRSREVLRQELSEKVSILLKESNEVSMVVDRLPNNGTTTC